MSFNPQNPIIVQSDGSILLEVDNEHYVPARDLLARFAELEKSPEYIHTYRISPLTLWNAASSGHTPTELITALQQWAKYPLPDNVVHDISAYMDRYGRVQLVHEDEKLLLISEDELLILEIKNHKRMVPYILDQLTPLRLSVEPTRRGHIKQALLSIGYPAEDLAGYTEGENLSFKLRSHLLHNEQPFTFRHYQEESISIFHANGSAKGGSGVIVLPCGAGKTVVGIGVMNQLQMSTLILTPNIVAARQWKDELLDKTDLNPDQIGEYTGLKKEICPITICTYQTITYRKKGSSKNAPLNPIDFPHFHLFNERDWGLIIYDEVHLLPAPVFRLTAELQARRRLGLTATLVREDGQEEDVFSLIGPKKYDVPWRDLEKQGWIATANVTEVRIPLPYNIRLKYAMATSREQARIAMENPSKISALSYLLAKHAGDQILIIGMYIDQLEEVKRSYGCPLITGKTPVKERRHLFDLFRQGAINMLIVSKVGNFSIDLPDANVMIQISGTFGSRQEEAQRLGRILRPKKDKSFAYFYSFVSKDTVDQDFSSNRQRFLTEQGYRYQILYEEELFDYEPEELNE